MLVTAPLMLLTAASATLMTAPGDTLSDTLARLGGLNSPARALEVVRTYLVYLGTHVDRANQNLIL